MQLLPRFCQLHADAEKGTVPLPSCQPHSHEKLIAVKGGRAAQIFQGIILKCIQSIEFWPGVAHRQCPNRLSKHRQQCQMAVRQTLIYSVYDDPAPVFLILVKDITVDAYILFLFVGPILRRGKFKGRQIIRTEKQFICNISVQIIRPFL